MSGAPLMRTKFPKAQGPEFETTAFHIPHPLPECTVAIVTTTDRRLRAPIRSPSPLYLA